MPDLCSDAVGPQVRNEVEHHAIHAGRASFEESGNVRDADDMSAALQLARWRFVYRD
jgi:hypothetical protein